MQNEAGASPASPAPVMQKSRAREYRNAYQRAYFGTVSACLPRDEKEAFREACRRIGKSQHEVLCSLVEGWMEEVGAFVCKQAPVVFK